MLLISLLIHLKRVVASIYCSTFLHQTVIESANCSLLNSHWKYNISSLFQSSVVLCHKPEVNNEADWLSADERSDLNFGRYLMVRTEQRLWLQFSVLTAHYFSPNGRDSFFCVLHEMRFIALPLHKKENLKKGRWMMEVMKKRTKKTYRRCPSKT